MKNVIVNQLHHIISIGLNHSNKHDSGTFLPLIKEILNKILLKRWMVIDRRLKGKVVSRMSSAATDM